MAPLPASQPACSVVMHVSLLTNSKFIVLQLCRAGSSEAPRSQHTPTESHQTTPEEELEPIGPRQGRRRPVDYVQLAAAMFGGPDGEREGDEDQDYSPGKDRQRASLGSADADASEKGGPAS